MPSTLYEIEVRGPVGTAALASLGDLEVVSAAAGCTTLRGRVIDQSALHGLLNRISGLGLDLVSVVPVDD